jgi:hypothetical protein
MKLDGLFRIIQVRDGHENWYLMVKSLCGISDSKSLGIEVMKNLDIKQNFQIMLFWGAINLNTKLRNI